MGIKRALKELGMEAAARLGAPRRLQRLLAPGGLTILMYHAVTRAPLAVSDWCFIPEATFRRQMKYLKDQFDVIGLEEAVERLKNGRVNGKSTRPAAVITFDDGYQNNYDVAFPILSEARMPATIFLTTRLVDTDETVWFCRLNQALAETRSPSLDWLGRKFDLGGSAARARASGEIQALLKEHVQQELTTELDRILAALGVPPGRPIERASPYRLLDHQSIQTMADSGLIEFGAHGHGHSILTGLEPGERAEEIRRSIGEVEALTGRPCRFFAYPNGRRRDYDTTCMETLRSLGIAAAVTTEEDAPGARTPLLELGRRGIGSDLSWANFQFLVHHAFRAIR